MIFTNTYREFEHYCFDLGLDDDLKFQAMVESVAAGTHNSLAWHSNETLPEKKSEGKKEAESPARSLLSIHRTHDHSQTCTSFYGKKIFSTTATKKIPTKFFYV